MKAIIVFLLVALFFTATVFAQIEDDVDEAVVMASELAYLQQAFVQTHNEVAEEVDTLFWQELGKKFRDWGSTIKSKFQQIFKPRTPTPQTNNNKNNEKIAVVSTDNNSTQVQVPKWLENTKLPTFVHDAIVRLRNFNGKVRDFTHLRRFQSIPDKELKAGLVKLLDQLESKSFKDRRTAIKKIIKAGNKAHKHRRVTQLYKLQAKLIGLRRKLDKIRATVKAAETSAAQNSTTVATPEKKNEKKSKEDRIAELKKKIMIKTLERNEKLRTLVQLIKQEEKTTKKQKKNKKGSKKQKKNKKGNKKGKFPKKDGRRRGRQPRVFMAQRTDAKQEKVTQQTSIKPNLKNAFRRLYNKIKTHFKKREVKKVDKLEKKWKKIQKKETKEKKTEEKKPEIIVPKTEEKKPETVTKTEEKPKTVEEKSTLNSIAKMQSATNVEKKEEKKAKIPSKTQVVKTITALINKIESLRNAKTAKYFSVVIKLKKLNRWVQSDKADLGRINTYLNSLIKKSGKVHPKIPEVIKKLRVVINASVTAAAKQPTTQKVEVK